jgi:uncharacterized protein YcbX
MIDCTLSKLFVYPIKSLAGFSVESWNVCKTGLEYDRKWMLIDKDGMFLSQRKLPKMALIKTALDLDALTLAAENYPSITIPLICSENEVIKAQIWGDLSDALHVSTEVDEWLSDFLGQNCRLVFQPEKTIRKVDPAYAKESDQTAFSDGFPFLLLAEASLQSLNDAMSLNFSMSRFRPNLVISGCHAFAEDSWREITIGAIGFRLPKPCSRCVVPTIDPETAIMDKEPLITLNRLRKWQNKVYFGQNALHDQTGRLTVGDVVKVVADGPKQPPLNLE